MVAPQVLANRLPILAHLASIYLTFTQLPVTATCSCLSPRPSVHPPDVYHLQDQIPPINPRPNKPDRVLQKLLSTLLTKILAANLFAQVLPKPLKNPLPKKHDPNVRCLYHMNAPGHSLKNC